MRTLEWLMVVFSIPAVAWTLIARRAWPLWVRVSTVVALLLLPLHAWLEGAHWQMIPIYLGVLILIFPLIGKGIRPKAIRWMGASVAVLLLVGLAFCYTLPMFRLPEPTGPYPVATRTLYFIDPSRKEMHPHSMQIQREVVVQIWYPSSTRAGKHAVYRLPKECDLRSSYQGVLRTGSLLNTPIADGKFPVILFNHAWRGFRNRSTYILQELASQGFVVIGISHPYNAAIVQLHDGRVADGRSQVDLGDFYQKPVLTLEQRLTLANTEMRIQTEDDKFLLDQLELINQSATDPLAGHLDLTRVGAFGHSFGGNVSAELAREDSRVVSVIVLDGVLHGPVADQGLDKPLFRIQAEAPEVPPGSENSPILSTRVHAEMSNLGERALAASFQKFGGYQVVIHGIDHENFTDKGFFSPFHELTGIGEIPQPRAAKIINAYISAFFQKTLKGQPEPILTDEKPPFPEVVRFQVWPPSSSSGRPAQSEK
jgi:predicted dienelactone hydrolase